VHWSTSAARRSRTTANAIGPARPSSGAFVKSAVKQVVSKRMVKKQQLRWTPEGAHLLLQARTRTLNGELAATFGSWHPAFTLEDHAVAEELPAAA
jgi:hypothetical protein